MTSMNNVAIYAALCLQILFQGQYAVTFATYLSTKTITPNSNNWEAFGIKLQGKDNSCTTAKLFFKFYTNIKLTKLCSFPDML